MKARMPAHPATQLADAVRRLRRSYRKRLARCKEEFSEKAVHDLRVETRRTLALLELLRSFAPRTGVQKLTHSFEKRLKAFGELRDVHVQQRLLKPLWSRFPEARALKSLLDRREEKLAAKLNRRIKSLEFAKLNRRLKELQNVVDRKHKTVSAIAFRSQVAGVLEKAYRSVSALRRKVREDQSATVHQLRIAFKRFRYLSELLRPVIPGIRDSRLVRMKRFQQEAGEIQDLEVLLMRTAHSVKRRKISPVNLRNLRHELQRRKAAATAAFLKELPQLDRFKPVPFRRDSSPP